MSTTRIFEELKVWDMSWIGVGPLTARYLADNGATVVRLDSTSRPDLLRTAPPFKDGLPGWDRTLFYGDYNCSKLGLGLNMQKLEAQALAKEMAQWADVVIESFTPGTMAKWGLSYEQIAEDNPGVIMLSTCMQGQTGPRAAYPGFGNLMAAMSGFYEVTGWPDRGPVPVYGAYTDFVAHRFTTLALIAALDHRERTDEGQYIDVSQYEASLQFLGVEFLNYEVNNRVSTRQGNAHPTHAPHGVYACQGEDNWIALAVETEEQWLSLKESMDHPLWADEEIFQTAADRKANESILNQHLEAWTVRCQAQTLFDELQPHLPVGLVHTQSDLFADPQIQHRGYFVDLPHPVMGDVPYNGAQAIHSETNNTPTKASPCIGEDSRYVLSEILGKDEIQIDEFIKSKVVEMSIG